tara:strand:+ start:822 stop:1046 length:225 start_codon:yes stop_codon:yes gene_type:complete
MKGRTQQKVWLDSVKERLSNEGSLTFDEIYQNTKGTNGKPLRNTKSFSPSKFKIMMWLKLDPQVDTDGSKISLK